MRAKRSWTCLASGKPAPCFFHAMQPEVQELLVEMAALLRDIVDRVPVPDDEPPWEE